MGWTPKLDMSFLPGAHAGPERRQLFDFRVRFRAGLQPSLASRPGVFRSGSQFNYRHWDASDSFNRDLFRFGVNLQLASPDWQGPWGWQANFDPSLNSDFRSGLAGESVNLDANVIGHYQFNPTVTGVFGVGYLDRVHDIIIPYAGVIYRPDDLWEFRVLFPQGRVSRYLGEFWWGRHWLYLQWEYHVESYQVATPATDHNQIQYQDYRLTFGMRSDHKGFTKYIEAGWVFGRQVDYKSLVPGFDVSDGLIVRGGIRF